jgi:sulfatase modifying factor 1
MPKLALPCLFALVSALACGARSGLDYVGPISSHTPATGGAKATGGTIAADGGTQAIGVTTNTGGSTNNGGASSVGGITGSGCVGNFETTNGIRGICVAKMATIAGPSASLNYQMDVTEVTTGQYAAWLATNPAMPASTDINCGWKSDASYAQSFTDDLPFYTDHSPVVSVDWCDAYWYCAGVGKRLCGAIGGGSNAFTSHADPNLSQWYRACSAAGTNLYPYGSAYQSNVCNDSQNSAAGTTEVGTLQGCVTKQYGFAGIYDLSGNVWEWEDSCNSTGRIGICWLRGGYFGNSVSGINLLNCDGGIDRDSRSVTSAGIGFRCCSR